MKMRASWDIVRTASIIPFITLIMEASLKRRSIPTRLDGAISQKALIFRRAEV
jgi:hypothetical protein